MVLIIYRGISTGQVDVYKRQCVRCDTLADPEKSVTGKPMNCWSLKTRVSGLWSGVCIRAGYYSLPAYAGVMIRGIEDKQNRASTV